MQLELRHIEILHTIADAGSMNAAARALGLSQPSITVQVQRLEKQLGGKIFRRSVVGVEPTEFGRNLLNRTGYLVPLLSDLTDSLQSRNPSLAASLRIGAEPGPLVSAVTAALLTTGRPQGVRLRGDMNSLEILERMRERQIEVGVLMEFPLCRQYEYPSQSAQVVLGTNAFGVCVGRQHRLWGRATAQLGDFRLDSWAIAADMPVAQRASFVQCCQRKGFVPHVTAEAGSTVVDELVRYGAAIALRHLTMPAGEDVWVVQLDDDLMVSRHVLVWQQEALSAEEVEAAQTAGVRRHRELLEMVRER